MEVENRAFSVTLRDCASRLSSASAIGRVPQCACQFVGHPKGEGARGNPRQPCPSIIVTPRAAVMGNPPLASDSGPELGGRGELSWMGGGLTIH